MQEELRCYTFGDFMYSSIQQGIQAGHASVELFNKYLIENGWQNGYAEVVQDWAANYKTMICLNAGRYQEVLDWLEFFVEGERTGDNSLPYAGFEEEAAQGGRLTTVAAILPERIFNGAQALREQKWNDNYVVVYDHVLEETRITFDAKTEPLTLTYNRWERDLMERLRGLRLAQ